MLQVVGAIWIMLMFAGCYGWLVIFSRWWRGARVLPPFSTKEVPWGLIDLIIAIVFLLLSQVIALLLVVKLRGIPAGTSLVQMSADDRVLMVAVSAVAQLLAFAAALIFVQLRTGASFKELGFDVQHLSSDLRLGGLAFVLLAPPVYSLQIVLTQWFKSSHPLIEMLMQNPDVMFVAVSGFAAVIVAPLTEEFMFRVLLLGWLERLTRIRNLPALLFGGRSDGQTDSLAAATTSDDEPPATPAPDGVAGAATDNPYDPGPNAAAASSEPTADAPQAGRPFWPVLASALIFALMHYSHGPDPIALFVLAVGMGVLYHRTHRITPGLVVHFLLNLFTLVALVAQLFWGEPPNQG